MSEAIIQQIKTLTTTQGTADLFIQKSIQKKLEELFEAKDYEAFLKGWALVTRCRLKILLPLHAVFWDKLAFSRNEILMADPKTKPAFIEVWKSRREQWVQRVSSK